MELTDAQWELLNRWSSLQRPRNDAGGLGATRGKCWKACYGFCLPERNGQNCRATSFRRTRPAIAASHSGCVWARWSRSCAAWPKIVWRAASWIWRRRLLTPPSGGQKKGAVQLVQHAAAKGARGTDCKEKKTTLKCAESSEARQTDARPIPTSRATKCLEGYCCFSCWPRGRSPDCRCWTGRASRFRVVRRPTEHWIVHTDQNHSQGKLLIL